MNEDITSWSSLDRLRRSLVRAAGWFLLLFALAATLVAIQLDPHGWLVLILTIPLMLAMIANFLWFVVVQIRLLLWRCPGCRRTFNRTWYWYWPFAERCLHCGLRTGGNLACDEIVADDS